MKPHLAKAQPADVPLLLEMIRELAEFEHLAHELTVTSESLDDALFGPHPVASAILARSSGAPAGDAVYYRTFSTFVGRPGLWLEDVYVRPAFRKKGLGKALFEFVARLGAAENAGRCEWAALRWNENALRFYQRLGARLMAEWVLLRMTSAELARFKDGASAMPA